MKHFLICDCTFSDSYLTFFAVKLATQVVGSIVYGKSILAMRKYNEQHESEKPSRNKKNETSKQRGGGGNNVVKTCRILYEENGLWHEQLLSTAGAG